MAVPYSRSYCSASTGGGSFPALRTARTPVPKRVATAAATRKPRESMPATRSAPDAMPASASVTAASPCRSANSGVRSLNWTPGSGKSATWRVSAAISSATGVAPPAFVT
jgi:hypothetical protein